MNNTYSPGVESYTMFFSLNETALLLNPFLKQHGYQFVVFKLPELEQRFSDLFCLPKRFESFGSCSVEPDEVVTMEFYAAVQHNPYFGIQLLRDQKLVLLKKTHEVSNLVEDSQTDYGNVFAASIEMHQFTDNLIQNFRLYKNGRIEKALEFQIVLNTKQVITRYNPTFAWGPSITSYSFTEKQASEFKVFFKPQIIINNLTELALSNYNLAYRAADSRSKFTTLMTALESIFNVNNNRVSKTISENYAAMVAITKSDFEATYKRMRELYQIRNTLVHGGSFNTEIDEITDELQDKVRKAINYCLNCHANKKELYYSLSQKASSFFNQVS